MRQTHIEKDTISDIQRERAKGRVAFDLTSKVAIRYEINAKVELWQGNFGTWQLFNTILRVNAQSGYSIDFQAVSYMRQFEELEYDYHRQILIVAAMNMLNENLELKQKEATGKS